MIKNRFLNTTDSHVQSYTKTHNLQRMQLCALDINKHINNYKAEREQNLQSLCTCTPHKNMQKLRIENTHTSKRTRTRTQAPISIPTRLRICELLSLSAIISARSCANFCVYTGSLSNYICATE